MYKASRKQLKRETQFVYFDDLDILAPRVYAIVCAHCHNRERFGTNDFPVRSVKSIDCTGWARNVEDHDVMRQEA